MPVDFTKYQKPAEESNVDFSKYAKPAATAASAETPWYDKQLIHPETWLDDASDADASTLGGGLRHVLHGGLRAAGQISTPKNLLTTAALAGLNLIPGVGEAADAIALGNGAHSLFSGGRDALSKATSGDKAGAEEEAGNLIPGLLGTALGGRAISKRLSVGAPRPQFGGAGGGQVLTKPGEFLSDTVAPPIAEGALGVTAANRAYDRTPGLSILEDTRGFKPKTVEESAQTSANKYNADIGTLAANHPGTVSLTPAIAKVNQARNEALESNNAPLAKQADKMLDTLTHGYSNNGGLSLPIPRDVPASKALQMYKGFTDQYSEYNPGAESSQRATSVANEAAHDLSQEINDAVPGIEEPRKRYAGLIPVIKRADITDRSAPLVQQIRNTLNAPTGALAGALAGAGGGLATHGPIGGLVGGGLGLVLPKLVGTPEASMLLARGLYNTGKGIQAAAPAVGDTLTRSLTALPHGLNPGDRDEEDQ